MEQSDRKAKGMQRSHELHADTIALTCLNTKSSTKASREARKYKKHDVHIRIYSKNKKNNLMQDSYDYNKKINFRNIKSQTILPSELCFSWK